MTVYKLQIPFVEAFSHSAKSRAFSDSFVVQLDFEGGVRGFGEGVSRTYVTGEDVDSSLLHIKNELWPALKNKTFSLDSLLDVFKTFPAPRNGGVLFHGAQAAVEMAIMDGVLRRHQMGLADLLPPRVKQLKYSAVVGSVRAQADGR